MPEESKKDRVEEIYYCSGHLADGDHAAEGCCCEGGVRCDSCGMHEEVPTLFGKNTDPIPNKQA
jgi:hypothetical protein